MKSIKKPTEDVQSWVFPFSLLPHHLDHASIDLDAVLAMRALLEVSRFTAEMARPLAKRITLLVIGETKHQSTPAT